MDQQVSDLQKDQCYIDGRWVGEPSVPVSNPATGEEIGKVPNLGTEETRAAIAAAEAALSGWRSLLASERAALLHRWHDLQIEHGSELARLMTLEQGKPLAEARGEVLYGAGFTKLAAEQATQILGETIPTHKAGARIVVIKQPIGVVGAITPWNFPNAMIARKAGPALAAGCTMVLKPAGVTPLSALALAELADRAGIPKGVFNVVTGSAAPIGLELTTNPSVRMITFTGSTPVGKLLARQSADTVKRMALELGGNAPFIIFDDADLVDAIDGVVASKFRNSGQTCVSANRIFVQAGVFDRFKEMLAERVSSMSVGPGLDDGVDQGPLIDDAAVDKVEEHVRDALAKGAEVVTGGKRHERGGRFFEPTILAGAGADMLLWNDETFGPVAPLISFETEDDVIAMANDTESGLASYFYTRDLGRAWRVAEALETGIVGINEGIISTPNAPFGGIKESGLGREGSHHGIEEYIEMKYILMGGLDK